MILIILACLLGIGSRRYAHVLPVFIAAYAGDTLWALAAYLGVGLLVPQASIRTIACRSGSIGTSARGVPQRFGHPPR
jgi:hypothetical protein